MSRASRLLLVALLGFTGVFVTASVFSFDNTATEAPAAFDGKTNDAVTQDAFTTAQMQFDQVEGLTDGLGPVYNAQSCRECHQSIVDGGASQVREVRAGHRDAAGHFVGAFVPIGDGSMVSGRGHSSISAPSAPKRPSSCRPQKTSVPCGCHSTPWATALSKRCPIRS